MEGVETRQNRLSTSVYVEMSTSAFYPNVKDEGKEIVRYLEETLRI
ncbi:TPA: hypothetical protein OLY45_001655 [Clostridioides difficile]|nr:hypothetical protein [Clostridioides difficile]MDI7815657.1 hypothetical protein [Clostridioides difficile]HCQ5718728.1 hypothetical protein [Clostridioides difficile]HCQ5809043.1 hypothetical protein [Clostridioides difficile]HEK4598256.1 hypothetical protein [Clostridioides difficile]